MKGVHKLLASHMEANSKNKMYQFGMSYSLLTSTIFKGVQYKL